MNLATVRQPGAPDRGPAISSKQWVLLGLLVASICINYVDRANLSTAAEELSRELHLDPNRQVGLLLSSFFWTYAAFQIPVGWVIDRYNVYWVYATGYFVWSAATAATGLANSFSMVLALRLLLGMAESVAYPAYSKIIAAGFPEARRGLPNALIDAGSKLGPFLGVLIGGSIVAHSGWRAMFIAIGGVSLLWLFPWVFAIRGVTGPAAQKSTGGPSILEIFRVRAAWGTFIGLLCSNYAWYFLLTWLPLYLRRERNFSAEMMAIYGSIPFLGVAASSVFGGWMSDFWISHGGSPTVVRKTFLVTGLMGATLMFPAVIVPDPSASIVLLTVACLSFGLFSSNVWAVTQSLSGRVAAGKWTGIQNTFGNVSGIVAPYFTGWLVDKTHSFRWAFIVTCCALVISAGSYLFLVRRVEPVNWNSVGEQ